MAVGVAPSHAELLERLAQAERELAQAREGHERLERELAEARDQSAGSREREAEGLARETATGEILPVIAGSPAAHAEGDAGRRLRALTEIGRLAMLGLEESAIVRHAPEAVARVLEADYVGLWRLDRDTGDLVVAATAGPLGGAFRPGLRRPPGLRTLNRVVLDGGRAFQTDDVGAHPDWVSRGFSRRHGLRSYVGVPLLAAGEAQGVLTVLFRGRLTLPAPDLELVEAIAAQAALALANARLLRAAERRAAEAEAVAEVGRAITGSLELTAVLDLIVDHACRLLRTRRSALAVAEREAGGPIYRFAALRGLGDVFPRLVRPRDPRDGTTAMAISERRTVWSADVLGDPTLALSDPTRRAVEAEGYRAALSAPLLAGDETLGALVVFRDQVGGFAAEEVRLLEVFAAQAAVALQNARAFEREQARRRQLEAVRDVTAELAREFDLRGLLELIVRRASALVRAAGGAVFLWDEGRGLLEPRAWHGAYGGAWLTGLSFRLGEGAAGEAAERRRGVMINDYRVSPRAIPEVVERSHLAAVVAEPILYQDRLIGVLVLGREREEPFGAGDAGLLRLFADQAAVAIENARLFEEAARSEAQGRLDRLKAEFLGTVSHELRTPLWLVMGYAEMLERDEDALRPEQRAMVGEIRRSAETMVRLVDDLLDFSASEQGQLRLRTRRVSVPEVLGDLVEGFRGRPGGERIRACLPRRLQAEVDPDRLTQIVSNLFSNALRYAPEGPVALRLNVKGPWVRVEVADRGPGVPPGERERIWEPFYRGAEEVRSPRRGTGLGLPVVRRLVELHGGQVGVGETPGGGATFWFTLPLRPAAAGEDSSAAGEGTATSAARAPSP